MSGGSCPAARADGSHRTKTTKRTKCTKTVTLRRDRRAAHSAARAAATGKTQAASDQGLFAFSQLRLPCNAGLHRSEEHTSELQSRLHLVCRLLLEKRTHYQIDLSQVGSAFVLTRPGGGIQIL